MSNKTNLEVGKWYLSNFILDENSSILEYSHSNEKGNWFKPIRLHDDFWPLVDGLIGFLPSDDIFIQLTDEQVELVKSQIEENNSKESKGKF